MGGQSYALSEVHKLRFSKVLSGEFTPRGRAAVRLKDLNYIQEAMEWLGIALPLTGLVCSFYRQLVVRATRTRPTARSSASRALASLSHR